MKPFLSSSRFTAISLLTMACFLLTACGQTGPLYLPKRPAADATTPATSSDAPQQNGQPANVSPQ